jgi:glutathione peroxidase
MYRLLLTFFFIVQTSIYSLHFTTIDGIDVGLDKFKGKKILFVNTASGSKYVSQYISLEKLYQKYKDSLVVIAFPSNDFSHEQQSASQIKTSILNSIGAHYIIASKTSVSGKGVSQVFQWLSNYSLNGVMDNPVNGDFYKYLIDGNGILQGVFSGSVDPMDSSIQKAITNLE